MESDTVVVRGFSNTFGMDTLDKKVDIIDLQFIEGEELERTWKAARRQRLKQQEEKIWSKFVTEEDIVTTVCKEDPYQFLEQLPPEQVSELMECELSRIKKELEDKHGAGDSPRIEKTESEEYFEIYDDNGEDSDQGAEENLNDSAESPCTVRERDDTSGDNTEREREKPKTVARASGVSVPPSSYAPTNDNSNENVASVIESSIYCAKVKELRIKIIRELRDMIISLETQNIASIDLKHLRKLCKRAAEYSARFQRIHLYQLQRQVNDIKRHNSMATPYGKHTQFQSQMVRIVSLHQNILQSLQVFHKSFEHTACLRECSTQLGTICSTLRDSTAACQQVAVPTDFIAAKELYNDKLLSICDDVEKGVEQYIARVDEYIGAAEMHAARRNKLLKSKGKKNFKNWSQKATKNTTTDANQSLSMYSLDTLRLNQRGSGKSTKTETRPCDTSRVSKRGKIEKDTPKSHRKSPRCRRPLMRDPHAGGAERRERTKPDHDVQTMIENIEAQSSHAGDQTPDSDKRSVAMSPTRRAMSPRRRMSPGGALKSPNCQPPTVPQLAITRACIFAKNSLKAPTCESPIKGAPKSPHVPPIALNSRAPNHVRNNSKVPMKRASPYIKPVYNLRNETTDTVTATQPAVGGGTPVGGGAPADCGGGGGQSPLNKVQSAKPNEHFQMQTVPERKSISGRSGSESPKKRDSSRDLHVNDTNRARNCSTAGSKSRIDSGKSESSRVSQNSGCRVPRNSKVDAREAEGYEMTKLLKHLCAGDNVGNKPDRLTSPKNAQLVCVNACSPRQSSTPQLLKILEETIQKKIPKHLYKLQKPSDRDRLRLAFNIPQQIADNLFQYRTKFVQHMLTSSMYANGTIGKPWEVIGSVSEQIIDEILMQCAEEMEMKPYIMELYRSETETK